MKDIREAISEGARHWQTMAVYVDFPRLLADVGGGAVRWLVLRFIARIVKGLLYIVLPTIIKKSCEDANTKISEQG